MANCPALPSYPTFATTPYASPWSWCDSSFHQRSQRLACHYQFASPGLACGQAQRIAPGPPCPSRRPGSPRRAGLPAALFRGVGCKVVVSEYSDCPAGVGRRPSKQPHGPNAEALPRPRASRRSGAAPSRGVLCRALAPCCEGLAVEWRVAHRHDFRLVRTRPLADLVRAGQVRRGELSRRARGPAVVTSAC